MNAAIIEKAPAKINLYLHVKGKRADGYHLLDSLVVFAAEGDEASDTVRLSPAPSYHLSVDGPYGGALGAEDVRGNLITKVLFTAAEKLGRAPDFHVALTKNLPLASGIGGGSADAAAALRAAARIWGIAPDAPEIMAAAALHGSDICACLYSRPLYFGNTGNEIERVHSLPHLVLLLINPGIPLPTGPVFKARQGAFTTLPRLTPIPQSASGFIAALQHTKNDLEEPARVLCEAIDDVLECLRVEKGCALARLSGSGATCFGLFYSKEDAEAARISIRRKVGEWWMAVSGF